METGDNDFDGIEVRKPVLAGANIVDSAQRPFVENSLRGVLLENDKIFSGFHEMWIEAADEEYAVEGEVYEFHVMRIGERSRDPKEESHYALMGIADSAVPDPTPLLPLLAEAGARVEGLRLMNGRIVLKVELGNALLQILVPSGRVFAPGDGIMAKFGLSLPLAAGGGRAGRGPVAGTGSGLVPIFSKVATRIHLE